MQKPLRYKANNWVDGMKLSSDHFVNTDLYFQDLNRDAISIGVNSFNYGLLPAFPGHEASFDIQILSKSTNYLEVNVKSCNAITADGCRIDIHSNASQSDITLSQYLDTHDISGGKHFVVLQVNPFSRIPSGEPNPDESPLRYPEIMKEYTVSVVSDLDLRQKQLNSFFIPIGQLVQEGGNSILNSKYIMPSSTLGSHPELLSIHNQLYTLLVDFQGSAFKIMEKTVNKPKITNLGLNIRMISEKILDHLSSNFFEYRSVLPSQSPLYLVKFFSDFAHVFYTGVKLVAGGEREEMLKYFYEWKDVTPSNFEERLSNVIEQQYNHLEIRQNTQIIEDFMRIMVSLWNKLSTLEYIGQRRENIVVAEQKVVQEVQTKRTWSLLD